MYDEYGEDGLEGGRPGRSGGGSAQFDFFDLFGGGGRKQAGYGGFGAFGGYRGFGGYRKSKATLLLLELTIAEVYNGTKKKIKVHRERYCRTCNGWGGNDKTSVTCPKCKGTGDKSKSSIDSCEECKGRGRKVVDLCKTCKGKGAIPDSVVLEVIVDKGVPEGYRYVFYGEADEFVTKQL